MVGSEFFEYLKKFHLTTYVGLEDFADKFNFNFTTLIFLMCTLIISVKQYIMKPIACYIPNMPSGSDFDDYLENYCWIHGTIPLMPNESTPLDDRWDELDKTRRITYYQWVPFMLGIQCIMFYFPRILWQSFCYNRTGTDLENIIQQSTAIVRFSGNKRNEHVKHIADMLNDMFYKHRDYRVGRMAALRRNALHYCGFLLISKRLGTWLVFGYMFVKFLYLANAIGQVILIRSFLGFESDMSLFGYELLQAMRSGRDWRETMFFPRVAHCNANNVRQVGVKVRFIAQCALPVNMLNEKIYIFLWFWILFCCFLTLVSIPLWMFRLGFAGNRVTFVTKYLRIAKCSLKTPSQHCDMNSDEETSGKPQEQISEFKKLEKENDKDLTMKKGGDVGGKINAKMSDKSPDPSLNPHDTLLDDSAEMEKMIKLFVKGYLRHDGVFLLRMIALNAGDLVCTDVVSHLWDLYREKHFNKDMRNYLNKGKRYNPQEWTKDSQRIDLGNSHRTSKHETTNGAVDV